MKSFSNLLERTENPSVKDNLAQGRANRKYEKKFNKSLPNKELNKINATTTFSDVERDSRGKSGESARKSVVKSQGQDDLLDKINKNKQRPVKKGEKFYGKPTGVDVKTGKSKYVPPKEIPGRSTYIDSKTNKASQKGIKSYISKARQMRTGSNIPVDSKTTDSIAKIGKSEYTDKINQKYGGRRAKRAYSNAPSLDDVQKQVDLKDRLKQKFGKGEYRGSGTKTKVVKQSEISKKIASDTKAYNQKRTSSFKDFSKSAEIGTRKSQSTTKFDRVNRAYDIWDDGDIGNPSSTQTPTKPKNPTGTKTSTTVGNKVKSSKTVGRNPSLYRQVGDKGQLKNLKIPKTKGGPLVKPTKNLGSDLTKATKGGDLAKIAPKRSSALVTGNKDFQKMSSSGKLDKYMKPKKGLITKSGQKTMKSVLTKVPKAARPFAKGALNPMRNVSSLKGVGKGVLRTTARGLGKVVGPAAGVLDYADFRSKGHSRIGSAIRAGVRTAGYYGGAALGGAAAGALGSVVPGAGTVAGGVAGGLAGGMLGSGAADWVIKGFDRVFGGKKLKDYKAKTVAGYAAKKQKKLDAYNKANPYGGKTPQLSKNKTKFDQGSFNTVKLKKAKDGSYVMPKGWKKNTGKDSTLTYKTTRLTS